MEYKICSYCKEQKPISKYYTQNKQRSNGEQYIYYNPECKECTKKKSVKWYKTNDQRFKEILYKFDHSEKRKVIFEKRKLKAYEQQKIWMKNNAEYMRNYNQKRRNNKKQLKNDLTLEEWNECLKYFSHCCAYCGISEEEVIEKYNKRLSQEHVISMKNGGGYTKDNIIPSCTKCNTKKGTKDFLTWYRKQDFYSYCKEEKILFYLFGEEILINKEEHVYGNYENV